jgi:sec-independent protein translocase protein TatA
MSIALMWVLGPTELGLILVIVLVVFGATKVPQLMRGLGQGIREFKDAVNTQDEKDDKPAELPAAEPPTEKES